MKNKGFTFVDLLGVIVIVIFIMLLTIPIVTNNINSKKIEVNETTKALILNAAKTYREDNALKYSEIEGSEYCVYLETLTDIGYLAAPIKDINNKDVTKKIGIQMSFSGNSFNYKIVSKNDCVSLEIKNALEKCKADGSCKVCVALQQLYNKHYLTSRVIIDNKDITEKKGIVLGTFKYDGNDYNEYDFLDNDDCTRLAILAAAKEYVEKENQKDPTRYKKRNGNTYCVSIKEDLVNNNYLILEASNKYYSNSVQVDYKNNKYSYSITNTCKEIILYEDPELKGNDPTLSGQLVPVKYVKNGKTIVNDNDTIKYNGCNGAVALTSGSWVVASQFEKWYDYKNQWWANAVLLKSGVSKKVGDVINLSDDAIAMFVWIPRYEYKISGDAYSKIAVNFIPKTQTSPSSGYIIPPGFKFGETNLKGLWAGKFFMTGTKSNPTILPQKSENSDASNLGTAFSLSQTFGNLLGSPYDSHVSKNSEFATIVYLSQSEYGKFGNSNYTGTNKKIYYECTSAYSGSSSGINKNCGLFSEDAYAGYDYYDDRFKKTRCDSKFVKIVGGTNTSWNGPDDGVWTSDGGKNETAELQFTFTTTQQDAILSFSYKAGSSGSGSYTIVGPGGYNKSLSNIKNQWTYKKVEIPLETPGDYTVTFKYKKTTILTSTMKVLNFGVGENYHDVTEDDNNNGIGASTTGNIYGVYDTSGSVNPAMMVFTNSSQMTKSYVDYGFSTLIDSKYYDSYYLLASNYDAKTVRCSGGANGAASSCYGHAMPIEFVNWGFCTVGTLTYSFTNQIFYFTRQNSNVGDPYGNIFISGYGLSASKVYYVSMISEEE